MPVQVERVSMLLHRLGKILINFDFSQVTLQLLYYGIVVLVHEYQVGLSDLLQ